MAEFSEPRCVVHGPERREEKAFWQAKEMGQKGTNRRTSITPAHDKSTVPSKQALLFRQNDRVTVTFLLT